MSPRSRRAVARRARCACLHITTGSRCHARAVARVAYRLAGDERTRRNDACGIHDHLSAFELLERGATVELKVYVRPRLRAERKVAL